MKRDLSCGALPVWQLLNHRGHRGRTYRQAQEAQNETSAVNFSFVAFAHFRGGMFFLPLCPLW